MKIKNYPYYIDEFDKILSLNNKPFKTKKHYWIIGLIILVLVVSGYMFLKLNENSNMNVKKGNLYSLGIGGDTPLKEGETITKRTQNAKVFKLPEAGKYRVEAQIGAIHYKENPDDPAELWKDINTTIVDGKVTKAPYMAEFDLTHPKFKIMHRKGGWVVEEIPVIKQGVLNGNRITYSDVFLDVDVEIIAMSFGVKQNLIVKTEQALEQLFEVELESNEDGEELNEKQIKFGRLIEIIEIYDANGKEVNFTRDFEDGKVKIKVEDTGELAFPITIDPTVMPQEQVGASSDDASQFSNGAMILDDTTLNLGLIQSRYGGLRFTTVPIPQGAMIDSASITVYTQSLADDDFWQYLHADDTDDSPTFSTDAFNISGRYITEANVTWQETGAGEGWQVSPEIKSLIQEVVDRGGWAEDNALSIILESYSNANVQIRTWDFITNIYGTKFNCTYTEITPPIVTLNLPTDNSNSSSTSITFNCSATPNIGSLVNATLYGNWSGWHLNETKDLTGSGENSTTFSKTISEGTHLWNCEVCNDQPLCANATADFTFTIDTTVPTFDNKRNFTHESTTSFSESYSATDSGVGIDSYWLNDTSNFSVSSAGLITNTTAMSIVYKHWLNITVNDTAGNENSDIFYIDVVYDLYRYIQMWRNRKTGENVSWVDKDGSWYMADNLLIGGDLNVIGIIINDAIYCESSDLVDQTFAVAGVPYRLNISNVDEGNGISMATGNNGTNITIDTSGVYHMVAQPQVKAGAVGGGKGDFHMWIEKNTGLGFVDVPDSNIELSLGTNEEDVIVLATTLKLNQGDVLRFVVSVSDNKILLHTQSPAGEPIIPSIIFTMYRVGS